MKLSRTTAAAVTLTFAGLVALTAACGSQPGQPTGASSPSASTSASVPSQTAGPSQAATPGKPSSGTPRRATARPGGVLPGCLPVALAERRHRARARHPRLRGAAGARASPDQRGQPPRRVRRAAVQPDVVPPSRPPSPATGLSSSTNWSATPSGKITRWTARARWRSCSPRPRRTPPTERGGRSLLARPAHRPRRSWPKTPRAATSRARSTLRYRHRLAGPALQSAVRGPRL